MARAIFYENVHSVSVFFCLDKVDVQVVGCPIYILKLKEIWVVWTGLSWLRIEISDSRLENTTMKLGVYRVWKFLTR